MQADLDNVGEWCREWLLKLNISKCKYLRIGNSQLNTYTIFDPSSATHVQLTNTNMEKDLGVWCSSDLKPSTQCHKAAAKAMRSLGFIKRIFKFFSRESLLILYKTYIRPHMEYCAQVWSPYLMKDIDILEKVQHRATKLIQSISHLPYQDRLKTIFVLPQTARRSY